MKRPNLMRGMTALLAALLSFALIMTDTAFAHAGVLNSTFNILSERVESLDEGEGAVYYPSDYGDVNHLTRADLDALWADEEAFARQEMQEGAVLLRNEGNALPLSAGERRITLFGIGAADPLYKNNSAGGNNDPSRQVSLYDALREAGFAINDTVFHACDSLIAEKATGGRVALSGENREPAVSLYTDAMKETFAEYSDAAVVVLGRHGGESNDVLKRDSEGISALALHKNEIDLLEMIYASGAFDKIILLDNSAYTLELGDLERYHVDACLWIGAPGLVAFRGVADLLTGAANPSGRLVDTYAADSLSAPATQNFGNFTFANAQEVANACRDDGENVVHYMVYQEGIYVGYKYYETRYEDCVLRQGGADSKAGAFASSDGWSYADEVVFPFGYGLSYTDFTQKLDKVTDNGDTFTVQVTVTNVGAVPGKSVVEVYAQTPYTEYDRVNRVEKSAIQLAGFEKTGLLSPGEAEQVSITVDKYLIASYDSVGAKGYILDAGDYYLAIGENAHDALNHILAAKGASGLVDENGVSVSGDVSKTYHWTQDALDTQTYRMGPGGAEVTNQFDDADLNYWQEGAVTYLTRQDWANTFPAPLTQLTATPEMIETIDGYWYETPADAPSVSEFPQGVDSGITFAAMHGIAYDDPLWDTFLDQLTLEDMAITVDEIWGTGAVKSVFKPQDRYQDGPGGVAGPYLQIEDAESGTSFNGVRGSGTAYVGQAVAASAWSREMIAKRGYFLGEDALFCGVAQLWCPGGNIHRSPFSGRNYEYYSEDGTLSYLLAAAQVPQMQAKGLIAAIKHFALNDSETNRNGVSTFTNEQALREIYLKSFEGAFVPGGALGTMTSYNRIGCTYSGNYPPLLRQVLRGEWGFRGATVSDAAFSTYMHAVEGLASGTDFWCLAFNIHRGPEDAAYITAHDDGALYEMLRESQHGFYYMLANSNLINGFSEHLVYVTVTPWWAIALYVIDGTLAGLTLLAALLYFRAVRGKGQCPETSAKKRGAGVYLSLLAALLSAGTGLALLLYGKAVSDFTSLPGLVLLVGGAFSALSAGKRVPVLSVFPGACAMGAFALYLTFELNNLSGRLSNNGVGITGTTLTALFLFLGLMLAAAVVSVAAGFGKRE